MLRVSGSRERELASRIPASIPPQTPLPPRLPRNLEPSSIVIYGWQHISFFLSGKNIRWISTGNSASLPRLGVPQEKFFSCAGGDRPPAPSRVEEEVAFLHLYGWERFLFSGVCGCTPVRSPPLVVSVRDIRCFSSGGLCSDFEFFIFKFSVLQIFLEFKAVLNTRTQGSLPQLLVTFETNAKLSSWV